MKEALFWRPFHDNTVQCRLCPHVCKIELDALGRCGARQNIDGKLISLVYGKPISIHVDPIEKKPLYHFIPGSKILSIGTVGCNLHCLHCQNWEISQTQGTEVQGEVVTPEKIIQIAKDNNCEAIAYTYNEPTIFYEYMLDIMKLARVAGMYNVIVSNGFINPEPLFKIIKFIDAANIDFKSINEKFYKEVCMGHIAPVLATIKLLHKNKVHLELTNLIIPTLNDKPEDIKKLCEWIKLNLDVEVPLHFSAFHPSYKLMALPRTDLKKLRDAHKIAVDVGLKHVYLGNVIDPSHESTHCTECKSLLIRRNGFEIIENKLKTGKCKCGKKLAGIY